MADEHAAGTGAIKPEGSASGRSPIVFVCDASAEAERITDMLRAAGYAVSDVPVSVLAARAGAQRPSVVVLDVDADGALDEIARLRKLPGSGSIDFLYLGSGDGIVKDADDALSNDGSAFFLRPIDVGGLVRKIEALTGGPAARRVTSLPPPSPAPLPSPSPAPAPPPSLPPSRGPFSGRRDVPSDRPSMPSLPAPGLRTPGPPLPMSTTSLADLVDAPRSFASFGTVSHELQQLLAEAELRAEEMSSPEGAIPSPEEEIEAVLPADVLASLDEPLDGDEDEEHGATDHPRTGAGAHEREGTGAHAKGTTAGGTRQPTTSSHHRAASTGGSSSGGSSSGGSSAGGPSSVASSAGRSSAGGSSAGTAPPGAGAPGVAAHAHDRRTSTDSPPRSITSPPRSITSGGTGTMPGSLGRPRTTELLSPASLELMRTEGRRAASATDDAPDAPDASGAQITARPSSWHPPPAIPSSPPPADVESSSPPERTGRGRRAGPDPVAQAVVLVGAAEARRFFAEAIARRATGALCFESDGVVRRIVMREGDLVAAASGSEQESLVHFLATRGELPRDEAPRLAAKIPPYGRHAGAALVAHGWLRQDQLWQVLRAHAEWVATTILRLQRSTAQLEPDPPGRLRGEPSVFGAATGPEIFVELVRRAVPVDDALARLGGEASRIADGPNHGLLAECNLPPQDLELLHRARGGSISDLLARATDGEIVAVVHALALLGVVEVVAAPDFGRRDERSRPDVEVEALDEEAIRARVRARLELVEEGDYFAVLGVTRDATGYEIRRAFIELRRAFEPSRILTPRLLDLADDVRKIIVVLEEAYEILRDNARRERYRRAIDAQPH